MDSMEPATARPLGVVGSLHRHVVRWLAMATLLAASQLFPTVAVSDDVLINGLAWRQLTDTADAGLTWEDVASVCPLDESPCQGTVKGVDFTGWIWASESRVLQMLETLIGIDPSATMFANSPLVRFFDKFDPVWAVEGSQGAAGLFSGDKSATGLAEFLFIRDTEPTYGHYDQVTLFTTRSTDDFGVAQGASYPLAVFLVRDPDIEYCDNSRDDDGDGLIDGSDPDCPAGDLVSEAVSIIGAGTRPSISPDGKAIGYTCSFPYVFCVYDSVTGQTREVLDYSDRSVSFDGEHFVLSNSGTSIAFEGRVAGGLPATANVYVPESLQTEVISTDVSGNPVDGNLPRITPDGRFVAFVSSSDALVASDPNPNEYDAFVYDRQTGVMEIVSRTYDGAPSEGSVSYQHQIAISDDGNYVVFASDATNLVAEDFNGLTDVFIVDRSADSIQRVNLTQWGRESEYTDVRLFNISGDGRFVAWVDDDGRDLVSPSLSGDGGLFVRDLQEARTFYASTTPSGAEPTPPFGSAVVEDFTRLPMSGDGGSILYGSRASDIVESDLNGQEADLFVYDGRAGRSRLVSVDTNLEHFIGANLDPTSSMDRSGRVLTYAVNGQVYAANLERLATATPESCGNTFDDDGDGLVDRDDTEDCPNLQGAYVRCLHDPVTVGNPGDTVVIRAEAVDRHGEPIVADRIEIWLADGPDSAREVAGRDGAQRLEIDIAPTDDFSYGCNVERSIEGDFSGWRTVGVGALPPERTEAIPVLYNGPVDEKIDIVFFYDRDEYTSYNDPAFQRDVGLLIWGGYFTVPWIHMNQEHFNFWLATVPANSGPDPEDTDASDGTSCLREAPERFDKTYSFADSGAIVHRSACRDNAGPPGLFTIEVDLNRLQVVAHETGHRPFGLADEYCCDGGYFTRGAWGPPFANMFEDAQDCVDDANDRGVDPAACRALVDADTSEDWWLFEPRFRDFSPRPADLMQGTGCDSLSSADVNCTLIEPTVQGQSSDPNGSVPCAFPLDTYRGDLGGFTDFYWVCVAPGTASEAVWQRVGSAFDRTEVGPSESGRVSWFVNQCRAGEC